MGRGPSFAEWQTMKASRQTDILKGGDRRTTSSGKVKQAPRRMSDLVRKNGHALSPVKDPPGSTDDRLERRRLSSKEASIEHAVVERRRESERPHRKDLDAPEQVFQRAGDTMGEILKAVRAHSPFSISSADEAAELLFQNLQTGDALLAYVFTNGGLSLDPAVEAVNVCILAVKFGLELAYTGDQLRHLSLAALLHDVGMARLISSSSFSVIAACG